MISPSGSSFNGRWRRTILSWVVAGILLASLALLLLPSPTGWKMALFAFGMAAVSALLFSLRYRQAGTVPERAGAGMEESAHAIQELKQELAMRDVALDRLSRDVQLARSSQDRLLALVNQEIRISAEGLLEMTELLMDSDLDARAQRLAKTIRNSAEGLAKAVRSALDSAHQPENGDSGPAPEEIDLGSRIREILQRFDNRARQKKLHLVANLPSTLPARVPGVPAQLPQLVENLLGITLTLSEAGEVHLDAALDREKGIPAHIELRFCNTGSGISHAQQAALFDALACSGETPPDNLDAAGRALFIARKLAKSMGGELVLQTPGKDNFCLVLGLPLKAPVPAPGPEGIGASPNLPAAQQKKILLADDNAVNRLVAVSMLQDLGFEVTVAKGGYSALKLARERRFDLILMDCHMPKMDGFVVSRAIREWERRQGLPVTPIIALTADIHPGIEEQCRAAGMDDYLSKPYSQETLAKFLSRWLPADETEGDTPGPLMLEKARAEERPILDEARLESLRSLGRERGSSLLEKAVRHYLEHTPAEIDRLWQAVSDHDLESIRLSAHNLKSSSSMLGAQRLAELFNSLEKKARHNHLEGAAAVMKSVEEMLPVVLEALQKAASRPTGNETTGRPETVKGSGRVLLVDDDPNFRLVTSASLREAGFSVSEAANGTEALKVIASDPPELVLLDALMEDIDGFEICSRIRELPETSRIPVLMVTGLEDTESVHKAFQAGAAGFITKPVNYPVLIHRIRFQIRVARESIELHESQQQLAIAQHLARLGHWRWEKASGKFIVSQQLAEICELTDPDRQDSLDDFLSLVHPDDREQVRFNIHSAMDRQVLKPLDYRIRSGSGKELFIHQELAVITPGTLLGTVQDITRQYESEQKIRKLAYSDELTGLASRSYFLRHLEDTINIASRHQERFSLLYLDLDSFKDINDTLGHDVGDELLKVVAKRLLKALHKSDFAARLGGDEFCILVDSLSINYAAEVASRCLEEVNRPVRLGAQTFNPRISIGIANYPGDGLDAQALLRAADSAMYAAKHAGKHRYAFYQPELTVRARKRLDMEHELRRALEEDQFELHYQPQVSLSTGKILGVEALIRWKHPRRGLVPPNEFIHVAERIGLIKRLGEWVLEAACTQARQWKDTGLPGIQMAVNISPLHFRDPVIVDQVGEILEKTGWLAKDLELEVTEGVVQTEQDNLESFRRLKDLGVRIAIDDFGTGYSSLSSLKKLPIDCLKVDQLFVRDMVTDPESATLVGTIVALAKALGLEVVAEGVETEEETQILTALGCDLVQGYYFSRPVEANKIPALLEYDFSGLSNVVLHERTLTTLRAGQ